MIPKINFDIFSENHIFTNRRLPKFRAFSKGIVSQMKRLNSIFDKYVNGSDSNFWDSGDSYQIDDEVYYNLRTYKSLTLNTNKQPDINENDWQVILERESGVVERMYYNPSKLCLEYNLNTYFKKYLDLAGLPGFLQPDDPISPTQSSIYITGDFVEFKTFVSFPSEKKSDVTFLTSSSSYTFLTETYKTKEYTRFKVNVPSDMVILMDIDLFRSSIKKILDLHLVLGTFYTIQIYES